MWLLWQCQKSLSSVDLIHAVFPVSDKNTEMFAVRDLKMQEVWSWCIYLKTVQKEVDVTRRRSEKVDMSHGCDWLQMTLNGPGNDEICLEAFVTILNLHCHSLMPAQPPLPVLYKNDSWKPPTPKRQGFSVMCGQATRLPALSQLLSRWNVFHVFLSLSWRAAEYSLDSKAKTL